MAPVVQKRYNLVLKLDVVLLINELDGEVIEGT